MTGTEKTDKLMSTTKITAQSGKGSQVRCKANIRLNILHISNLQPLAAQFKQAMLDFCKLHYECSLLECRVQQSLGSLITMDLNRDLNLSSNILT